MTDVVFLPGIIAPATLRYARLLAELPDVTCIVKDLHVYDGAQPPADYSIATEVAALDRAADGAGLAQLHLYGHSAGGAVALAYVAAYPQRVLSLAVDEPAVDFTDEGDRSYSWEEFDRASTLPTAQAMAAFLRLQVADDVELSLPEEPSPPWMASRPAGVRAFIAAARSHHVDPDAYRRFSRPVYFSLGSRTHPRWFNMQQRLARLFPDFISETYQGLHHLHTSHQAEPARTAVALRHLWARAES